MNRVDPSFSVSKLVCQVFSEFELQLKLNKIFMKQAQAELTQARVEFELVYEP